MLRYAEAHWRATLLFRGYDAWVDRTNLKPRQPTDKLANTALAHAVRMMCTGCAEAGGCGLPCARSSARCSR